LIEASALHEEANGTEDFLKELKHATGKGASDHGSLLLLRHQRGAGDSKGDTA
jgi:hypothetical protein